MVNTRAARQAHGIQTSVVSNIDRELARLAKPDEPIVYENRTPRRVFRDDFIARDGTASATPDGSQARSSRRVLEFVPAPAASPFKAKPKAEPKPVPQPVAAEPIIAPTIVVSEKIVEPIPVVEPVSQPTPQTYWWQEAVAQPDTKNVPLTAEQIAAHVKTFNVPSTRAYDRGSSYEPIVRQTAKPKKQKKIKKAKAEAQTFVPVTTTTTETSSPPVDPLANNRAAVNRRVDCLHNDTVVTLTGTAQKRWPTCNNRWLLHAAVMVANEKQLGEITAILPMLEAEGNKLKAADDRRKSHSNSRTHKK